MAFLVDQDSNASSDFIVFILIQLNKEVCRLRPWKKSSLCLWKVLDLSIISAVLTFLDYQECDPKNGIDDS